MQHVTRRLVILVASMALAGAVLDGGARAQDATREAGFDPTARFPAHIHAGGCDNLGAIAFPLGEAGYGLPIPDEPAMAATPGPVAAVVGGQGRFNAAAVGVSLVAATLDELVDAGHAIDVHNAADGLEAETRIVCGEVGGFLAGGDLVFGLHEQNASNYGGIAWLHENPDGTTTVSIYVASGLSDRSAERADTRPPDSEAATTDDWEDSEVAGLVTMLPAAVQEATIEVRDGNFGVDELTLREGEATTLQVVNRDDRSYRLRIGDLVTPTPVAPNATTEIHFTAPTIEAYSGQLLEAEGDQVLDTVLVAVQLAGEIVP